MVPTGDVSNLPASWHEKTKSRVIGEMYISDGVLTKSEARELIQNDMGGMDIVIYGNKSRIVALAGKYDITESVMATAISFLENAIGNQYADLAIHADENNPKIFIDSDNYTLDFRRLPYHQLSYERISVDIKMDGVLYQTIFMAFHIEGAMDVLMAVEDIPARSRLDEGQFESRRVNIQDMDIIPCQCEEKLQDMLSIGNISKGQILASSMISGKNAVESGERVLVESIAGNTRIFMYAVAVSSGRVGDMVRLRNMDSADSFEGVVQGVAMAYVGEGQ